MFHWWDNPKCEEHARTIKDLQKQLGEQKQMNDKQQVRIEELQQQIEKYKEQVEKQELKL